MMNRPRDDYWEMDDPNRQRGYEGRQDYSEDRRMHPDERRPPRHERPPRDRPPTYKPRRHGKSSRLRSAIDITVRILILILLLAFFTLPQFETQRNQFLLYLEEGLYQYKDVPDYIIFDIEREMTIETSPDTEVREFTLTIEKPFDFEDENGFSIQEVQDIQTQFPEGRNIVETDSKFQISWWGNVGFNDEVTIKVHYEIKSAHIIWDVNSRNSATLSDIPTGLKTQYNHNDWLVVDTNGDPTPNPYYPGENVDFYRIQPTDPDINKLAHDLIGSETNVYKILDIFYKFLDQGKGESTYSGNVGCQYPDQGQMDASRQKWGGMPKPALATLEDWVGDCDDQSFLLISMCRAVGIPARVEAGALFDLMVGQWGGHGWAQVYIPMDDGTEAWATIDMVNNHFLERDPSRFTDYIDIGRVGMLESYYTSWVYDARGSNVLISEEYGDLGFKAIPSETIVHV